MKHFKIRRINGVNTITIDGDVTIKLTDREIGKLSYKLQSFLEVQASKDSNFSQSDKNFWAKMAQE